ncbi:DNA repair-scaffolding protein isoform X4 [Tympanuchus pallidicinctus]|uniref:DNA repair-scaffolding protein isoform X4 n=1 Tax=Tympanuchus pallidicinctus TaxID=109042 RepID=UPI0022874DC5|nr:DNA repair-scaffolding protein isoform X4 [Tympanuchus pallidicinctus]
MPSRKRKRFWNAECASFPDETTLQLKKSSLRASVAAASISSAWLRCGDGFASTSMLESLRCADNKSKTKKHLGPLLTTAESPVGSAAESSKEVEDIIWTSSGSDFSDNENKTSISRLHSKKSLTCKAEKSQGRHFLLEDRSDEDESEFIDWEKDSDSADECNESEKDDSSLEISDTDSCTNLNSLPGQEENDELCKLAEISEYSSDNDYVEEVDTQPTDPGFIKKLQLSVGEVAARPASDWLKSAQALLQTPKKQSGKASRTPEDSAKKRKLLRGGLAERLCRLQNRERSAISFWRHQCISDAKIPSDKSGVLIVKILEMFEECMIQVAICQQLEESPAIISSEDLVISTREPIIKVLFARETAAHLKSRPQDVIHIYPPWQKLLLKNADIPVIMNTYFSQKVLLSEHLETSKIQGPTKMLIRKNIVSLAQTFKLDDLDKQPQESSNDQVACAPQLHNTCDPKKHPLALGAVNDSLLEMVESQGAVGWREVQVRVIIQRVYYLPAREGFRSQIQGNKPVCATPIINSDPLNVRALGLFSLIDSLWPPVVPVKVPGQSQDSEMMTTNLPPPSFCYVLTVQSGEIHMEVDEEETISKLYQPPTVHNLKEILQMGDCHERCSFWARVLYLRPQTKHSVPVNQREMLLFVTDFALQSVVRGIPKVVAVSVTASCVLSTEIIEALNVASRFIFFKDALWGNGRIICVERTVLLLQKPLLCSAADADLSELPGPVKLDELDSTTQANSICAVRGTVVGVNESTAFSWPTCDRCGNGKLELYPQDSGLLYCNQCSEVVISPVLKMQLEVFLSCPSQSQSTVKVKLLQRTISSLLMSAANVDGSYEASSVLGKELGPLPCLLLGAGGRPGCSRLEEVALLPAGPGGASG